MENSEKKTEVSYSALLHITLYVGGTILAFSGLVLIVLKFFGYPLLFEGIISVFMGLTAVYVIKIYSTLLNVLDLFTNTIDKASEKMGNAQFPNNGRIYKPEMYMDNLSNPHFQTININDSMSPEELMAIKDKFPHLSGMIDSMLDMNDENISKKNIAELTLAELNLNLKEAIKVENFEEAQRLKKEIATRK